MSISDMEMFSSVLKGMLEPLITNCSIKQSTFLLIIEKRDSGSGAAPSSSKSGEGYIEGEHQSVLKV